MTIKITSWNIEGRLSDSGFKNRGTPNQIIQAISEIDADILFLAEAHSENSLNDLTIIKKLYYLGYKIHSVNYDDDTALRKDTYTKQLSLIFASKLPIDKFEIIKLGDLRNALVATINNNDEKIRIIGVHLDDRSEETRIKQTKDLVKIINKSDIPTIVMGDFNAMHSEDLWPAKFLRLRLIRFLSKFIFARIASKAVEMARGECLKYLENNTNLSDADPKHQPTTTPKIRGFNWLPSIRLIQIDHIFISPEIKTSNFTISLDLGADHRAISTWVTVKSK